MDIYIKYVTTLGTWDRGIEMFLYEDGEKMTLYPRDDDHTDLLIDGFQRGCHNEFNIHDERGTI